MAEAPFFSVVVPTFNRANLITNTLRSIQAQTFRDFEVIVVDDGSTDETEAVVKGLGDPRIRYHLRAHGERGAARNAGARLARGLYINFLDSDDLLYPHHLATAAAFIAAHGEPEVCHFAFDVRDASFRVVRGPRTFTGTLNDQLAFGNSLTFNAAFVRRDIALRHPFSEDPDLTGEDWHLWLRLGARYPLWHADTVTSSIVNHGARSVLTQSRDVLVTRVSRLLDCLFDDDEVKRRYGRYERRMRAGVFCYLALHLALGRLSRIDSVRYLARAVATWPPIIVTRDFLGALKRLVLSVGPAR